VVLLNVIHSRSSEHRVISQAYRIPAVRLELSSSYLKPPVNTFIALRRMKVEMKEQEPAAIGLIQKIFLE